LEPRVAQPRRRRGLAASACQACQESAAAVAQERARCTPHLLFRSPAAGGGRRALEESARCQQRSIAPPRSRHGLALQARPRRALRAAGCLLVRHRLCGPRDGRVRQRGGARAARWPVSVAARRAAEQLRPRVHPSRTSGVPAGLCRLPLREPARLPQPGGRGLQRGGGESDGGGAGGESRFAAAPPTRSRAHARWRTGRTTRARCSCGPASSPTSCRRPTPTRRCAGCERQFLCQPLTAPPGCALLERRRVPARLESDHEGAARRHELRCVERRGGLSFPGLLRARLRTLTYVQSSRCFSATASRRRA